MSIDGPQRVETQIDQPASQRRTFLDVLSLEIRQAFGLGAAVVMRDGCMVLYVGDGSSTRCPEIACDMTSEGWRFAWADDGRTIAPVEDVIGTACAVFRALQPTMAAAKSQRSAADRSATSPPGNAARSADRQDHTMGRHGDNPQPIVPPPPPPPPSPDSGPPKPPRGK